MADYELRWPPELVVREITAVFAMADTEHLEPRIEFVLAEAFAGDSVTTQYRALRDRARGFELTDPWSNERELELRTVQHRFLERVLAELPNLRQQPERRPYWSERHRPSHDQHDHPALRRRFAHLINEFRRAGRFGSALPEDCVDQPEPDGAWLTDYSGFAAVWPLRPDQWDRETFLSLIEVFHDVATRPRNRWYHQFDGCGWHYRGPYSTDTGQALYRWRVNRLLDASGAGLRLADAGEDLGRLVHSSGPARDDLFDTVQASTYAAATARVATRVDHAIALFRGRAATVEDKRSAVIALAGVLEERRALIRTEIGKDDEGALFNLANNFAIRHHRRGQHPDYDPAFLDWMFWWYLATVELTNTILTRDQQLREPR